MALKQLKPEITAKMRWDSLDIFLARDITNSPIITINEDAAVNLVARLMKICEIGYIIVTSKEGKPMGIITERDLATRVLAKNSEPSKMTAKDVMTSPIITIELDVPIRKTARTMSRLRIGKLGVVYKDQLVGMISKSDIVTLLSKMNRNPPRSAAMDAPMNK